MPDRLTKDPVLRTVEDILAFLVGMLIVAVVVLAFAVRGLSDYIKQPAGRNNRVEFQCQIERRLHVAEVDCRG